TNGQNSVTLGVIRQSRANTLAVSAGVRAELERLRPQLPESVRMTVATDDALFIRASIVEVVTTLLIAVGVVVLVIFTFLYSARATLIPTLVIPVSVVGSFMLLAALGFSINLLTLLALILAIGLVVDDAIVVLEWRTSSAGWIAANPRWPPPITARGKLPSPCSPPARC
ncbi:MAG: AcrB/AcrD/AcrF family protein, partial [Proteobacteria bacterium]|nr:AcrB/AcrD/AcrF family protein [Pseudomonadota bacterium]